jgi:hypothetical protein
MKTIEELEDKLHAQENEIAILKENEAFLQKEVVRSYHSSHTLEQA